MAQLALDGSQVRPPLQRVGSVGVTQPVGGYGPVGAADPGASGHAGHNAFDGGLGQVTLRALAGQQPLGPGISFANTQRIV